MRGGSHVQLALPSLDPQHKTLLAGMFGAFVVELILHNMGVPLYAVFAQHPVGEGLAPWQTITRFVVQGTSRGAVTQVLLSLFILGFFLPAVEGIVRRRTLVHAVLAGVVGGSVLATVADMLGLLDPSLLLGWSSLVTVLPIVYGLARPDQTILLFVFPVRAGLFVWGALVLSLLYLLSEQTLETAEGLGVWIGVVAWWHGLGPAATRRELLRKAATIERQLDRFKVLPGGRNDDDIVH